jgi:hypothetical protein
MSIATLLAMLFALLAGLMLWGPAAAAEEEWPRKAFGYKACRGDLYWGRFCCGGRYRPEGCRAWRAKRASTLEQGHEHSGAGRRCLMKAVHVWSGQHTSEDNSKADAKLRWMIAVQSEHGNIYMSFPLAADVVWRCFQSQVPDTFSGKSSAFVNKYILGGDGYHMACQLWARPCAAPFQDEPDTVGKGKR